MSRGALTATHVEGSLLFAGEALAEKVVPGPFDGNACVGYIFEFGQIIHGLRADARLLEIAGSVGILGVDVGAGFGAFGVFEPAVVVGDLRAEVVVVDRRRCYGRRRGESDSFAAMDVLGEDTCLDQANQANKPRECLAHIHPLRTGYPGECTPVLDFLGAVKRGQHVDRGACLRAQ